MTNRFDPYAFFNRVEGKPDGDPVLLSDDYAAKDLGVMLKSALRAIELLSSRVAELESRK